MKTQFLERMEDWARQWGEREHYYMKHEDLIFALTHSIGEVLVLNQKVYCGSRGQYLFYRNVILINNLTFVNIDQRIAGH